MLAFGSCCTKVACDLIYHSTSFAGFTAEELDTVRVIIEDMEHLYPPDTLYTQAVFYSGGGDNASLAETIPFQKRSSYTYYLPATGKSYVVNGYEFSSRSCNTCFPSTPKSDLYDELQAYRVNDVRYEGNSFVIRK